MRKMLGLWLLVLVVLFCVPGWHAMAEGSTGQDTAAEQQDQAFEPPEAGTEDEVVDVADAWAAAPPAQVPTYTVRFRVDDETWVLEVSEGDVLHKPNQTPSKAGYRFLWWYDMAGSERVKFDFDTPVTRDMKIAALFEEIVEEPLEQTNGAAETASQPEQTEVSDEDQALPEAQEPAGQFEGGSGQEEPCYEPLDIVVIDNPVEDGQATAENPEPDGQAAAESPEPDGQMTPERFVTVVSSVGDVVQYGDLIVLTGRLTGCENTEYRLQWQVNRGSGWEDLPGEVGERYTFVLDADSYRYQYRLAVTVF